MDLFFGLEIAGEVMAIPGMASENHGSIKTRKKRIRNEHRVDPPRAHHPDDPRIGRILKSGNTGKICTRVGTPVTEKGQDLGLECHLSPLNA
jgi:hypothetical protein